MAQLFKDKEELDEFLHNLGIEYRFSCYEEKNPDGELHLALASLKSLPHPHRVQLVRSVL